MRSKTPKIIAGSDDGNVDQVDVNWDDFARND